MSRTAAFVAIVVYLLLPGAAGAFLAGVPLGLWGLVALALVVFTGIFFRDAKTSVNWTRMAACVAVLVVMKIGATWASMPTGWRGSYYASGDFSGRLRRSTDFLHLDATRIDRAIDFRDDYFPVYFLNEADFNRGIRREVTEPVSARWVGHVHPGTAASVTMELAGRGSASVSRDGEVVLRASTQTGSVSRTISLDAGEHALTVDTEARRQRSADQPARRQSVRPVRGSSGDAGIRQPVAPAGSLDSSLWRRAFSTRRRWLCSCRLCGARFARTGGDSRRRPRSPRRCSRFSSFKAWWPQRRSSIARCR